MQFWEMTTPEWIFSTILNAPIKKSIIFMSVLNLSHTHTHTHARARTHTLSLSHTHTLSLCIGLYQYLLFNRETLFLHGEGRGERDRGSCEEEGVEVMRASQVATILSNLSNNDSSVKILAEHPGILRYM